MFSGKCISFKEAAIRIPSLLRELVGYKLIRKKADKDAELYCDVYGGYDDKDEEFNVEQFLERL